jgi:hypothetical protein
MKPGNLEQQLTWRPLQPRSHPFFSMACILPDTRERAIKREREKKREKKYIEYNKKKEESNASLCVGRDSVDVTLGQQKAAGVTTNLNSNGYLFSFYSKNLWSQNR